MRGFDFDGFTRPRGENLEALLAEALGIDPEPVQPKLIGPDELPDEIRELGLAIGAALGADAVTVLRVPKHPQRRGHPGRNHPAFAR